MTKILPAFDKEKLKKQLFFLTREQQLAFAVLCCERLIPNYKRFFEETQYGNLYYLLEGVSIVWHEVKKQSVGVEKISSTNIECENCAPSSSDHASILVTAAQDACFSVCALLDYIVKPDGEKIVLPAMYATDTVDLLVQEFENMKPNDSRLEEKINTHPAMQQELQMQKDSLSSIKKIFNYDESIIESLKKMYSSSSLEKLL